MASKRASDLRDKVPLEEEEEEIQEEPIGREDGASEVGEDGPKSPTAENADLEARNAGALVARHRLLNRDNSIISTTESVEALLEEDEASAFRS